MRTNTCPIMHCMKLTVGRILHACFKVLSTLYTTQLGNDTNANISEILHPAMLLYDKVTPALAYCKFNTGIFMNDQLNVNVHVV